MMRTTLDIEDPVLLAVKELARRQGRSAGAVASALIRKGLAHSTSSPGVREPGTEYGFRPFGAEAADAVVTDEQVNRLRDELGI